MPAENRHRPSRDSRTGPTGRIAAPPRPPAAGTLGLVLLVALSGASCTRTETRTNVDTQEYSTSVTIVSSRAESQLARGREAIAAGRFAEGIAAFEGVYDMPQAKPDDREQALLGLGQAYSNVLNPGRDVSKALDTYRRVLSEFPETKRRSEVERAIGELEKSQTKD